MEKMSHADYVEDLRRRAAAAASAAIAGQLDFLEACLEIGPLLSGAELPPGDDRAQLISCICSELESLPIGAVRAQWSPEALERLEPQLRAARLWAAQQAMPLFESLAMEFRA
jgi:hypothetical protein